MITDAATVDAAVAALFGDDVRIASKHAVSGGCINETSVIALSNGEKLFLKENSARFEKMFLAEAKGLAALRIEGGPRVPEPVAVYTGESTQYLLMTYISPGRPGPRHYEDFARSLALLHKSASSDTYGFDEDNFIGSTPQRNPRCESWVTFYGEHRLGYQIRLAGRRGLAGKGLVHNVEAIVAKLPEILPEPEHPSILHGDLWTGNAMSDENGDAVMIDPAAYYGHNEADLAMTELFGRFPASFYRAYNEVMPIDSAYDAERRTLYNLYHILNHLNLFGTSYAGSALAMTRQFT